MQSICGYINKKGSVDENILNLMNAKSKKNGFPKASFLIKDNVGIAIRNLSIRDREYENQPISNENGKIQSVCNGIIYNYLELKNFLVEQGHIFQTNYETEIIVHAYEEWSDQFIESLNGVFAIAIWDEKKRKLVLIRDRVGIKPLYYTFTNGNFIFASEIKSILNHPDVNREIDYKAIDNFLRYKYIPSPDTAFKGIKKVRPGYMLSLYKNGSYEEKQYWNLQIPSTNIISTKNTSNNLNPFIEGLNEVLSTAVRSRLVSDVPVGAFLSGGIDSSIIVGLMSEIVDVPVKTFSIGFEQKSFNELKYAGIVAKHFGTEHHEFEVNPKDVFDLILEMTKAIDEPYGDAGAIANYLISKHASEHVAIALSGIGADEAFAGYERYWVDKAYRHYHKIPAVLRNALIEKAIEKLPVSHNKKSIVARAKKFIHASKLPLYKRYVDVLTVFTNEMKEQLYSEAFKKEIDGNDSESIILDYFKQSKSVDFLAKSFYVDLKTILVDDYLLTSDRASTANTLEVRAPFLDYNLLEYAVKIPSRYKLNGYTTKHILKEAYKDLLPKQIINRGKYGFESPIGHWIQNELKDIIKEMLLGKHARKRGYFNYDYIEKLLHAHYHKINDYKKQIFCLLTFEIWCQEYID